MSDLNNIVPGGRSSDIEVYPGSLCVIVLDQLWFTSDDEYSEKYLTFYLQTCWRVSSKHMCPQQNALAFALSVIH